MFHQIPIPELVADFWLCYSGLESASGFFLFLYLKSFPQSKQWQVRPPTKGRKKPTNNMEIAKAANDSFGLETSSEPQ